MRNFKVNGTKVSIVNRCTNGMEINSLNQKYDIMIFNAAYNAWTSYAAISNYGIIIHNI